MSGGRQSQSEKHIHKLLWANLSLFQPYSRRNAWANLKHQFCWANHLTPLSPKAPKAPTGGDQLWPGDTNTKTFAPDQMSLASFSRLSSLAPGGKVIFVPPCTFPPGASL
jgi:hypothetical protein